MLMVRPNEFIEPRPGICYYAMLSEPNRELTAQANLRLRRVPFYLPTIYRAGRLSARLHAAGLATRPDISIALFPRTLFIAEDVIDQHLTVIRTAPGMMSHPFMKFGEHYARLRPVGMEVIQTIEAGEREKYFRKKSGIGIKGWMPNVGEKVRFILEDVFGGMEATVSDIDEKGRITLLTEILKRATPIKNVTTGRIEPV